MSTTFNDVKHEAYISHVKKQTGFFEILSTTSTIIIKQWFITTFIIFTAFITFITFIYIEDDEWVVAGAGGCGEGGVRMRTRMRMRMMMMMMRRRRRWRVSCMWSCLWLCMCVCVCVCMHGYSIWLSRGLCVWCSYIVGVFVCVCRHLCRYCQQDIRQDADNG